MSQNNGSSIKDAEYTAAEDNSMFNYQVDQLEFQTESNTSCTKSSSEESVGEDSASSSEAEGEASSLNEEIASSSSNESVGHSDSELSEEENDSSDDEGAFFSPKVHDRCELTQDECVLDLMKLFIQYKMSKTQMGGVLKCILNLIPATSNLLRTQYSLFNFVKKLSPITENDVIIHYYCSKCIFYLGKDEINCTLCSSESHKFYQLPLAAHIKCLFEQHNLADLIDKYAEDRKNSNPDGNYYCDLLDGSEFKRACLGGPYYFTLMGQSDGISVSDSSDMSWSVEWVVGEIPPRLRYKYVLINGIWVDECKPYMNTFMKPFVEELKHLHQHGVQWTHPRTKQVHTTRITARSFCVSPTQYLRVQFVIKYCA